MAGALVTLPVQSFAPAALAVSVLVACRAVVVVPAAPAVFSSLLVAAGRDRLMPLGARTEVRPFDRRRTIGIAAVVVQAAATRIVGRPRLSEHRTGEKQCDEAGDGEMAHTNPPQRKWPTLAGNPEIVNDSRHASRHSFRKASP